MSSNTYHNITGTNIAAGLNASDGGIINIIFGTQPQAPHRQPCAIIPFPPDPEFINRPEIMTWIQKKCALPPTRAALIGLGGVGKSQLAIHYAHQVRTERPDTWVFWVHAGSKERFEEGYRQIAETLRLPWRDIPPSKLLHLVYDWLRDTDNGQWLIILDNADELEVLFPKRGTAVGEQQVLASFLPKSQNGSILVTSRNKKVAQKLVGSKDIFEIGAMSHHDALRLLETKLEHSPNKEEASELVRTLEHLPLAVSQAAAFINQMEPHQSISVCLEKFHMSDRMKLSLLGEDGGDIRRDESASNSVITTWQITFEQLRHEQHYASDLLSFMSVFSPQEIPKFALITFENKSRHGGEPELDEDLRVLRAYLLVVATKDGDTFEMHPLVQFCTRVWISSVGKTQYWKNMFLRVMAREHPFGLYDSWNTCEMLAPHVEWVSREEPDKSSFKSWAQLIQRIGYYWLLRGKYGEAESLLRHAIDVSRGLERTEGEHTIEYFHMLGLVLHGAGKYEEAEQVTMQVLGMREKKLGKGHIDTLSSLHNLALALQKQGRYKEAEQIYREVLAAREVSLGKEHIETLTTFHSLADTLGEQEMYGKAEEIYREVLSLREKVLGKDNPATLITSNCLASVLRQQGKYEEAEQIHRKALATNERVLGKKHPITLITLRSLAQAVQQQENHQEAEQMYHQVAVTSENILGREHPNTLMALQGLASVMQGQKKYQEAEQIYRAVLAAREKVLGSENDNTLRTVWGLAQLCRDTGRPEEAADLFERAAGGLVKALGPDHSDTRKCREQYRSLQGEMSANPQTSSTSGIVVSLEDAAVSQETAENLQKAGEPGAGGFLQHNAVPEKMVGEPGTTSFWRELLSCLLCVRDNSNDRRE